MARVATGRGRTDLAVPVRPDGLDRVLTLVRRVVEPPLELLDRRAPGVVAASERQASSSVHLTVLDLTDLVPLGDEHTRAMATAGLVDRLRPAVGGVPDRVRAVRLGSTDATCFLVVDDDGAHALRRRVAALVGRTVGVRGLAHVVNLARFVTVPSASALLGVDRRRLDVPLRLGPLEVVWTDKRLSAAATDVVAVLDG